MNTGLVFKLTKFSDHGWEATVTEHGRTRVLTPLRCDGLELTGEEPFAWGTKQHARPELAIAYALLMETFDSPELAGQYATVMRDQWISEWPEFQDTMVIHSVYVARWLLSQWHREFDGEPTPAETTIII